MLTNWQILLSVMLAISRWLISLKTKITLSVFYRALPQSNAPYSSILKLDTAPSCRSDPSVPDHATA